MTINKMICNKTFNKTEIKKLINWFLVNYGSIRTSKLLDKLKILGFKYSTLGGISIGMEDLKIPKIKNLLIKNTEKELEKNEKNILNNKISITEELKKKNDFWNITNEILKKELIKNFRQTNLLNPVYMMTFSGARGNISQIKQLVGMRGLMSDSKGEIISLPIKSNLKEGLKIIEYFISCYGARKGLIDTAIKTADSGYLTRRLIYVAQRITIKQFDCNTKNGILIKKNIKDKKNFIATKDKIIGRVLAKDIFEKEKNNLIATKGQDICNYIAKKILKINKNKYIYIRSVLTCKLNRSICQLCYGWNLASDTMITIGEAVGIIAAQSIGEPGTQLTMRTFHTGGIFSGKIAEIINTPHKGIINYSTKNGGKKIKTRYGEDAFLLSKPKKITVTENRINKSIINLPKNSIVLIKPKKKVFSKQIIAEISNIKKQKKNNKNYRKEIRTPISGETLFQYTKNIKEKNSNNLLWILKNQINSQKLFYNKLYGKENNVVKFKINQKSNHFLKTKNLLNKKLKDIIKLNSKRIKILTCYLKKNKKQKKIYELTNPTSFDKKILINKKNNQKILKIKKINEKIGDFILKNKKTREKIKSNYSGQIIEIQKRKLFIKKGKFYPIPENSKIFIKNKKIIKKNNVIFVILYQKSKTEDIVQGLPKIVQILEARKKINIKLNKQLKFYKENKKENGESTRKSINKIQRFLIKKIQSVYQSQGVEISDKHLEIIIKQMTSKIIIIEKGESNFLKGEILEINKIEKINKNLNKKIKYEPIVLGITKICRINESFISSSCFQETTRILTKSALKGDIDWMKDLKENIIMGNLIPTGTGYKI
uniref:DNA-directed RNA polymerase n=1 Tax=Discoplastis spathirhyncha TaxID=215771 RepID=A0A3G3LL79_9EUGL|nr:RNA polymerase beta'' subunit [Discoplastis spathirhyncha]AYQ93475.1 RNA polymerase beta'' subunit [Discoplastis spathirhyncha]